MKAILTMKEQQRVKISIVLILFLLTVGVLVCCIRAYENDLAKIPINITRQIKNLEGGDVRITQGYGHTQVMRRKVCFVEKGGSITALQKGWEGILVEYIPPPNAISTEACQCVTGWMDARGYLALFKP